MEYSQLLFVGLISIPLIFKYKIGALNHHCTGLKFNNYLAVKNKVSSERESLQTF